MSLLPQLAPALGEEYLRRLLLASTVSAAAQAAVDTVREALHAEVGWSGVISGDCLTMAAYSGLRTAEMTVLWRLQVGQGVGGRVAKEGRTIAVRDYRHDPRRVPVMKRLIDDEGIRAAICAPLASGDEVLGVLYAAERYTREWTADEAHLVTAVAHDAGTALAGIRAHHRDRQRVEAADRSARAAVDSLGVVRAVAMSLAETEDVDVGLGVLAHHLAMHVELVDLTGEVLREASLGAERAAPARLAIDVGDEPLGTLRFRGGRDLTPSERDLAESCGHLIALQLLRERAALQSELRVHSEFLDDLLKGSVDDRHGIHARAALLGVDLNAPRFVACVGPHGRGAPAVTRRVLAQVEQAIRGHFPRSVVVPRAGNVVVLLEPEGAAPKQVHRALREVVTEPADLAAGLGRMCLALDDYADSYAEASLALDLARTRAQHGEVLSSADLGLYGLIARGSTRQSLDSIVEGALGPLLEADAAGGSEYVKTLDAFLASDRRLERAANRLHVHPNTVRYRLAKVQEMLGVSLRDVDDRFLLELALRVRSVLDRS